MALSDWYERYERRPEGFRLSELERRTLVEQIGRDGHHLLLDAVYRADDLPYLRQLPAIDALRQIWVQQFFISQQVVHWREANNHPPGKLMLYSPYDTEARLAAKRETQWQGYKVHLTETVDPTGPHLITDVHTTESARHR